jgi:hypothetical protein
MADETKRRRLADTGLAGLISDAFLQISDLFRGELDLARTEVQENLKRAVIAIGLVAAAIVLFLVALNVLAAALVSGVAELGIGAGWAALIVGGAFLVIGLILALTGKNKLTSAKLAPSRTTTNIRRDVRTTKEATHG